jgi:6-phosphogluconate dehydrogenase
VQLGMIGLGRMGANMARRLIKGGHRCVVYDRNYEAVEALVREGATGSASLEQLVASLSPPRASWVMVPAGAATEQAVAALAVLMSTDDIIVDGGNTHFKDDLRRDATLRPKGIRYVDVGTSGGVFGLERGYCLTIGGDAESVERLAPIFETLAAGPGSALHCGRVGAGHLVKMVHNGIEYGLMQAYAEGFDILRHASSEALPPEHRYELPLADIAQVWRRGSIITSFLLDILAAALDEDPHLDSYTGFVDDSGEGRWTVMAALEEAVPADVISSALYARFRSRREHTFAEKVLSAMRRKFGGHMERPGSGGRTGPRS